MNPSSTPMSDEELREQIEKLFNARINGSGEWIGLKLTPYRNRVWIPYSRFMDIRDGIASLVDHHTKEAVDKAVLEKAIELRDIAEAHQIESSAAWAIAQEIGAEVSRLKAELAAPAIPKTDTEGSAADE